jgi:flagellar biosynthesis/type III secretory pathway protein FliH
MNNEERNKDALIAHIQALDTIIRNRNNEIAMLRRDGQEPIPMTEIMEKKIANAYKKGWKAAYKEISKQLNDINNYRQRVLYEISEPPAEGEK